jgi:hypothetical protein
MGKDLLNFICAHSGVRDGRLEPEVLAEALLAAFCRTSRDTRERRVLCDPPRCSPMVWVAGWRVELRKLFDPGKDKCQRQRSLCLFVLT